MDNNRLDDVQPLPHASKRHHLVFWVMGLLIYLVVVWRMFTHPAAQYLFADVDSHWYIQMAARIAEGRFWDVQHQSPFMPMYSLLMVPAFWMGQPELGPLFAFSLSWVGFLIGLFRLEGPRWIVLVPFCSLPILNIYLLAWSEVLSLPLMALCLVNLAKSSKGWQDQLSDGQHRIEHNYRGDNTTALLLVLLVLARWANLYFVGVVGLIWALETTRNYSWFQIKSLRRLALLVGPSLAILFMVGLLNLRHTGHFFGYEKVGTAVEVSASSGQDWWVAISQLFSWFCDPMARSIGLRIGLWTGQALLFLWLIKRGELALIQGRSALFLSLALGYGLWIGITERITELDVVDFRLLSPCLLMTWLAFAKIGIPKVLASR